MKRVLSCLSVALLATAVLAILPLGNASQNIIERVTDNMEDDFRPSIQVDASGRPHIAWMKWQAPFGLYYAVKDGAQWSITKLKTLDPSVFHMIVSLSLDTYGRPHIAYIPSSSRWELWYTYWDENSMTWQEECVADGGGNSHVNKLNLVVDSTGTPHIAWAARWGGGSMDLFGVFYAKKSGGSWQIETISHDDDAGISLFVDKFNVPHVVWFNERNAPPCEIRYASRINNAWTIEVVATGPCSTDGERSLFVDSSGVPHVTFINRTYANIEIWYANRSGGSWHQNLMQVVDPSEDNYFPSVALDSKGTVYIVLQRKSSIDRSENGFQ